MKIFAAIALIALIVWFVNWKTSKQTIEDGTKAFPGRSTGPSLEDRLIEWNHPIETAVE